MNANSSNGTSGVRRIFIDCTSTSAQDTNTGVQRVVRNIVNHAARIGPGLGITCRGVVFHVASGFVVIDEPGFPSADGLSGTGTGVSLIGKFKSRVRAWVTAAKLIDAVRAVRRQIDRAVRRALFPLRRRSERGMRFGPGDVLLLIDDSWRPDFPWDDVHEAQSCGAQVGLIVYDLIPLQFPHLAGTGTCAMFRRWWARVRITADFAIGISRSALAEIDAVDGAWEPRGIPGATSRRGVFRLGTDLEGAALGGPPGGKVNALFRTGPRSNTYLMVGMISPRKNYAVVLDAFDRLWADGADVNLSIAGKYGWDCAEIAVRIRRHPQFGMRLFWFEDVSDHELDYCYHHAAALITASCAEGFNLPIIEALKRGCPVLASDLPVHREVGGQYAAFFPTGDTAALRELVARHQQQGMPEGVKSPSDFHWPDWTESCRELLECVLELGTRSPAKTQSAPTVNSAA
jgi:glycosyltransferase involved in cell wall biosynthesis